MLYLNANPAAREAAGSACCGESLGTAARLRASLHTWLELFKGMCQNTNLRAQKGTGTSGVQANGDRATAAKTLLKVFCRCTDLRVGQSGPSPPRNPVVVVETQTCPEHLIFLCPRATRTRARHPTPLAASSSTPPPGAGGRKEELSSPLSFSAYVNIFL